MRQEKTPRPVQVRLFHRGIALCIGAVGILSGCGSIGTQYLSPLPSQPAATLVSEGGSVFVHTHDDKGCYQGRTEIPGEQEVRLWPGRETVFAYEVHRPMNSLRPFTKTPGCLALVSFVPQDGAHYIISSTGAEMQTGSDGEPVFHHCSAVVFRKNVNAAPQTVPVKKLRLRQTSIACIQAVEG